jgi:hypothetical protein
MHLPSVLNSNAAYELSTFALPPMRTSVSGIIYGLLDQTELKNAFVLNTKYLEVMMNVITIPTELSEQLKA